MKHALSLMLAAAFTLSACGEAKKAVVKAGVKQLTVENVARDQPKLKPVFDADPELAQRYIDELKRAVDASGGALTPQVYDQARAVLTTAMSTKVVEVETPLQRRMVSLAAIMFRELQDTDPSKCTALIMGQPVGNLVEVLSEDYTEAEFAVMAEILSADPVARPPADPARGMQLVTEIVIPAAQEAGVDLGSDDWLQTMTGEQACDVLIGMTDARSESEASDLRDMLAADRDATAGQASLDGLPQSR